MWIYLNKTNCSPPKKNNNNNPVTDHIISLFKTTHWLSVLISVKYQVYSMAYKILQNPAPPHHPTIPLPMFMHQEPPWPPCYTPTCETCSYLGTLAHVISSTWNALAMETHTSQHHSFQIPFLCSNVTLMRKFLDNTI